MEQEQSEMLAAPVAGCPPLGAQTAQTKVKVEKIADGVYYATATGAMITGSNDVVIVNGDDVLLVDAGTTPAVARANRSSTESMGSRSRPTTLGRWRAMCKR